MKPLKLDLKGGGVRTIVVHSLFTVVVLVCCMLIDDESAYYMFWETKKNLYATECFTSSSCILGSCVIKPVVLPICSKSFIVELYSTVVVSKLIFISLQD